MGKVTNLLNYIKKLNSSLLFQRYKKVIVAQGLREYNGMNPDQMLNVEVRLVEEELLKRILATKPIAKVVILKRQKKPTKKKLLSKDIEDDEELDGSLI